MRKFVLGHEKQKTILVTPVGLYDSTDEQASMMLWLFIPVEYWALITDGEEGHTLWSGCCVIPV